MRCFPFRRQLQAAAIICSPSQATNMCVLWAVADPTLCCASGNIGIVHILAGNFLWLLHLRLAFPPRVLGAPRQSTVEGMQRAQTRPAGLGSNVQKANVVQICQKFEVRRICRPFGFDENSLCPFNNSVHRPDYFVTFASTGFIPTYRAAKTLPRRMRKKRSKTMAK